MMMCQAKFSDRTHQKSLIDVVGMLEINTIQLKCDHKGYDRTKGAAEKRQPFLTGWETGIDSQLTPPKAAYTVKPVARQTRDQQLGFLFKAAGSGGIRSKPFVFVQSLSPEAYLRHYSKENSYLANLYATGTQQQQQHQQALQRGFPVRLSSPPPYLSPLPPPPPPHQPLPQLAAARSSSADSSRAARLHQHQQQQQQQQSAAAASSTSDLSAAASLGQQVELFTKKIIPASYFIIRYRHRTVWSESQKPMSGRQKPEPAADKRLEPLTLLTERTFKFLTDSSGGSSKKASKTEARTGTPRLTHQSKPRVPTAERARLRDFTSAHFGPALQQRLRLLTDAESVGATTLATTTAAASNSAAGVQSGSLGLVVSGVSRANSRQSEQRTGRKLQAVEAPNGSELQGLITAGLVGSSRPQQQRWFDTPAAHAAAAPPAPYVAAARFGESRRK